MFPVILICTEMSNMFSRYSQVANQERGHLICLISYNIQYSHMPIVCGRLYFQSCLPVNHILVITHSKSIVLCLLVKAYCFFPVIDSRIIK